MGRIRQKAPSSQEFRQARGLPLLTAESTEFYSGVGSKMGSEAVGEDWRQSCQEAPNAISQYQPCPALTTNFDKVRGTVSQACF